MGVLIEVPTVAFEAFGMAQRSPVGDFVKGAGVLVGIVKAFCGQGLVAVMVVPLPGKFTQGKAEALAGEVGRTGVVKDVEATQLDDEFEAVGAGHRIPADVIVAFAKPLGSAAPAENADQFGQATFGVTAINALPENMSCRAPCLEVVSLIEDRTQVVDFGFLGGGSDHQRARTERGRSGRN